MQGQLLSDKGLKRLRKSAHRQSPFGAFIWKSKRPKGFGLASTIRKRGKPIKRGNHDIEKWPVPFLFHSQFLKT